MDIEARDLHVGRGWDLRNAGRSDLALRAFDDALAADPEHAAAHTGRCLSLLDCGRLEDALEAARTAAALAPDDGLVWRSLAWVQADAGSLADAVAAAHTAVRLDPEDSESHRVLARVLRLSGDHDGALAAADRAVALAPQEAAAHCMRSTSLLALGRFGEARAAAARALAIEPGSYESHATAAWAAKESGDPGAAAGHFGEALRIRPTDRCSRTGLVQALRERSRLIRTVTAATAWFVGLPWAARVGVAFAVAWLSRWFLAIPAFACLIQSFAAKERTVDPIADGLLRFDRDGRYLLTADRIVESDRMAVFLFALTGVTAAVLLGADWDLTEAALFTSAALPAAWIVPGCGSGGRSLAMGAWYAAALTGAGFACWRNSDDAGGGGAGWGWTLLAAACSFALAQAPVVARRFGYPRSHRYDT